MRASDPRRPPRLQGARRLQNRGISPSGSKCASRTSPVPARAQDILRELMVTIAAKAPPTGRAVGGNENGAAAARSIRRGQNQRLARLSFACQRDRMSASRNWLPGFNALADRLVVDPRRSPRRCLVAHRVYVWLLTKRTLPRSLSSRFSGLRTSSASECSRVPAARCRSGIPDVRPRLARLVAVDDAAGGGVIPRAGSRRTAVRDDGAGQVPGMMASAAPGTNSRSLVEAVAVDVGAEQRE